MWTISEVNTEDLIDLMNDVYEYNRVNSAKNIDDLPKLKKFFEDGKFHSVDTMINSYIIPEAQSRLYKVVPTILKRYMGDYLREFEN